MGAPLVLKHIPSARQMVRAEAGPTVTKATPNTAAVKRRFRVRFMANLLEVPV